MFRRDRPPRRRGLFRRLAGPSAPPLLIEANSRFAAGDYNGAALLYEQVAAYARRPRNAARLLVEAGRARLLAGQVEQAMPLFRRGLDLLAQRRRWSMVRRLGDTIVQDLTTRGHAKQAAEISAWLNGQPAPSQDAGEPDRPPVPASASHPPLPTRCPSCGGPVDPRDVEWVDAVTAECDYCGGMIRAGEE